MITDAPEKQKCILKLFVTLAFKKTTGLGIQNEV